MRHWSAGHLRGYWQREEEAASRWSPVKVWLIRKRPEKGLNLDEQASETTMVQAFWIVVKE